MSLCFFNCYFNVLLSKEKLNFKSLAYPLTFIFILLNATFKYKLRAFNSYSELCKSHNSFSVTQPPLRPQSLNCLKKTRTDKCKSGQREWKEEERLSLKHWVSQGALPVPWNNCRENEVAPRSSRPSNPQWKGESQVSLNLLTGSCWLLASGGWETCSF